MSFSSGSYLKHYKKLGVWKNSTNSMRVSESGNEGYSYRALIFKKLTHGTGKNQKTFLLVNKHNFSPTTTGHYYTLVSHAQKNIKDSNVLYFDFESMNFLESCPDFAYLKNHLYRIKEENSENASQDGVKFLVEFFEGKRAAKKHLEQKQKEKIESDIENKKRAARDRLQNSIQKVNYKTPKTFLAAIKKYNAWVSLNYNLSEEKILLVLETFKTLEKYSRVFGSIYDTLEKRFLEYEKLNVLTELGD